MKYDEKAIADAQQKWRDQDMETWNKRDPESMKRRHYALLDLLCAHIPLPEDTPND